MTFEQIVVALVVMIFCASVGMVFEQIQSEYDPPSTPPKLSKKKSSKTRAPAKKLTADEIDKETGEVISEIKLDNKSQR